MNMNFIEYGHYHISINIEIYLYADDTAILIAADSEDSLQRAINDL